jgi:hypothetical protein
MHVYQWKRNHPHVSTFQKHTRELTVDAVGRCSLNRRGVDATAATAGTSTEDAAPLGLVLDAAFTVAFPRLAPMVVTAFTDGLPRLRGDGPLAEPRSREPACVGVTEPATRALTPRGGDSTATCGRFNARRGDAADIADGDTRAAVGDLDGDDAASTLPLHSMADARNTHRHTDTDTDRHRRVARRTCTRCVCAHVARQREREKQPTRPEGDKTTCRQHAGRAARHTVTSGTIASE